MCALITQQIMWAPIPTNDVVEEELGDDLGVLIRHREGLNPARQGVGEDQHLVIAAHCGGQAHKIDRHTLERKANVRARPHAMRAAAMGGLAALTLIA